MSNYLQHAFDEVCKEAEKPKEAEEWYVALVEEIRVYLGPEEGGNWGTSQEVQAYQKFNSEEAANAAAASVRKLASELKADALRAHGEYCQRSMEQLEAKGLEADYLPEPDGPAEYQVIVSQGIPENYYPSRGYE